MYKIALFLLTSFCSLHAFAESGSRVQAIVFRLKPGQDVKKEIDKYVVSNNIQAASIVSAVGSLNIASIRFADKDDATKLKGPFEVVSLTGTTAASGSHLHISISDGTGKTFGGHLMDGSIVYTTLELVLDVYPDLKFQRIVDHTYGYEELDIQKK